MTFLSRCSLIFGALTIAAIAVASTQALALSEKVIEPPTINTERPNPILTGCHPINEVIDFVTKEWKQELIWQGLSDTDIVAGLMVFSNSETWSQWGSLLMQGEDGSAEFCAMLLAKGITVEKARGKISE